VNLQWISCQNNALKDHSEGVGSEDVACGEEIERLEILPVAGEHEDFARGENDRHIH
jgi:hypothetical protein